MNVRRSIATVGAAGALATGSLFLTSPAQAAPVVVVPGGLVTVTLVDVADVNVEDVTIQVPVAVAANICDVNASVLLAAIEDTGTAECDARGVSRANN